jgi:hypothetical protein
LAVICLDLRGRDIGAHDSRADTRGAILGRAAGRIRAVAVPQLLGMDSNWILEQIMDTPEREPETQGKLVEIFAAIDDEDFALARQEMRVLEKAVGLFPERQGARSMVDRLEILLADEKAV